MKLTRNPTVEEELLNQMVEEMRDDSRADMSVTGMIYCLTKNYLNETEGRRPFSRRQTLLFYTGLALEEVILPKVRTGEVVFADGLTGHTDHSNKTELDEVKSTRKKMFDDRDDEVLTEAWNRQFLSYLHMTGLTEGRFIILYLMGNYAPPFPDIRVYNAVATPEEIATNWEWIKDRKTTYLKFKDAGEVPTPYAYRNFDKECDNCEWAGECEMIAARLDIIKRRKLSLGND
jgi:hypothetical protein